MRAIESGRVSERHGSQAMRDLWAVANTMNLQEDGTRGQWVPWRAVKIVAELSPRIGEHAPDAATVERYAAHFDALPPIEVQRETLVLIDGRHRLEAAPKASRDFIRVIERDIPDADLIEAAIYANVRHGRSLTQEQRLQAARIMYQRHDPNGPEDTAWTPGRIAEWSGVGARTIEEWMLRADRKARQASEMAKNGGATAHLAPLLPEKPATRLASDGRRMPTGLTAPEAWKTTKQTTQTAVTLTVERLPDPDYVDPDAVEADTSGVASSGRFEQPTMRAYHVGIFRGLSALYAAQGDITAATYVGSLGDGARESVAALLPAVRRFLDDVAEELA